MALFSLIAKLGLDKSGFDAGLKQAGASANQFGSTLSNKLASAFSISALAVYTRHLVEYASKVKDASLQTGASTDAIETLGHAAKLTGADFDRVTHALGELSKHRQEALDDPGHRSAEVFRALGIDAQKLRDLKLEDLFREIARAFQSTDFGASSLAMLQQVLGKHATELMPLFVEGIDELEQQARDTGVVLGESLIEPLDEIGDQIDEITGQLRGPFAEALVGTLKVANEFVRLLNVGLKEIVGEIYAFQKGFRKAPEGDEGGMPTWLQFILGIKKLRTGGEFQLGERTKAGIKNVRELFQFEAQKNGEGEQGDPGDGLFFGFRKDVEAGERKRRVFNFAEKLREPKVRAGRIQSDELGKIGGTVGGGEGTTDKHLRDLIREMKELRRSLEMRGVRINGEL